jgi:hypothetical protein
MIRKIKEEFFEGGIFLNHISHREQLKMMSAKMQLVWRNEKGLIAYLPLVHYIVTKTNTNAFSSNLIYNFGIGIEIVLNHFYRFTKIVFVLKQSIPKIFNIITRDLIHER